MCESDMKDGDREGECGGEGIWGGLKTLPPCLCPHTLGRMRERIVNTVSEGREHSLWGIIVLLTETKRMLSKSQNSRFSGQSLTLQCHIK